MRRRLAPVLLALVLTVGGCSGGDSAAEPSTTPVPGGAAALPGPAPAGLRFKPAPADSPGAPAFTGKLTDDTPIKVADFWADRPVVLTFLSSWCTICAERQNAISDLAREYRDRVVFIGVVSEDKPGDLDGYLRDHRVEYPVVFDADQTIWRSYAVREPPAIALVAQGGTLLRGWPGGLDATTLDAKLHELVLTD